MRRLYGELPGEESGLARPVLDIVVEGMAEAPLRCLVDSGALHTLMPTWVAKEAGLALGRERRRLRLGGGEVNARFATAHLSIAGHQWEAPVGFCNPWPYGWGLLGQTSFLRFFVVTFRAADWELELEPIDA